MLARHTLTAAMTGVALIALPGCSTACDRSTVVENPQESHLGRVNRIEEVPAERRTQGDRAALPEPFPLGAHLLTSRCGYDHHGIYVGGGHVVHYAGLSRLWRRGPVEEVSLEQFADGRPVQMKPALNSRYNAEQIVARARSRLGENCYRITRNNCEHFCEWCIAGESRSEQVELLLALPMAAMQRLARFSQRVRPEAEKHADPCAV
jgi:hypothetical protein